VPPEPSLPPNPPSPLQEGELVLLRSSRGDSYLLRLTRGATVVEGRGVMDLGPVIGASEGTPIDIGGRPFTVLRPSLADRISHLRRKAQIITPKDAQALLYLAGVSPGSQVAEAGSGSGGLTLFLAHAVGPAGHVDSFDVREAHQTVARSNLAQAGYLDRVTFHTADVRAGVPLHDLDAWLLDLPDPWEAIPRLLPSLRPGGSIATYTPTYNQLERTVRTFQELGLSDLRAEEHLVRGLHVGEGGTRPEFEMLGHTGFLASARRIP
jgi:tRNA (adenine57-N1/adenine58-N1)-methyltransferase